ncbi:adenylyl-sulfate kinase [Alphaproteobacteria bacterium]|nr:adenylyl-sulfate kinase [Alphaproteobacteria bacterium]
MLIIFSGLPGVGKSAVSRLLSEKLPAVYLRIDSIEQSMIESKIVKREDLKDYGYRVAYSIAADNLRIGLIVIADSVNPIQITRDAWKNVAAEASSPYLEVELICSDLDEHRKRVEFRKLDIDNFVQPTWEEVQNRYYEPWNRDHLIIDTARYSANEAANII